MDIALCVLITQGDPQWHSPDLAPKRYLFSKMKKETSDCLFFVSDDDVIIAMDHFVEVQDSQLL